MITTPAIPELENIKVSNLFCENRREWDGNLIRDVFNVDDADRILRIPLSNNLEVASWLWLEDEKGQYTVKSEYRFLDKMQHQVAYGVSDFNWLKMWSLAMPPKVKNFIWRALHNCVPTPENLRNKHVEVYPVCPVCNSEIETLDHILISCSFFQLCWKSSGLSNNMLAGSTLDLQLGHSFKTLKNQDLEMLCSLAWNLWAHRNLVVWNHRRQSSTLVVNGAGSMLFQWHQAQGKIHNEPRYNRREGMAIWQKPDQGWITCNIDAVVKTREARSSFGCVLRNEECLFVAAYGGKLDGITDPKIAETMAFREDLSWLKNRNSPPVFIELDSLGVVSAFHSNVVDTSYFGSIIDDC